jgi:hypothetical protein
VNAPTRHLLALGLVALSGCSSDERVDETPAGSTGSSSSSSSTGAGGEAPTAKRQVFERNPIGGPTGNLLADGDFEMSIVSANAAGGQYGWVAFDMNGGVVQLLGETGGICKTGLRCGRVQKNAILFARGTAAPGEVPHRASIMVKALEEFTPPPGKHACDFVTVYVINCDNFDIEKGLKGPNEPDADGWCELAGEVPPSTTALCMYAETKVETLADSATLLAAPDLAMSTQSKVFVSDELSARMQRIREIVRSRLTVTPESLPIDPRERWREEQ